VNSAIDLPAPSLGSPGNPLRVAIIGSGPSGFYAAEALLKLPLTVSVDMIERLPVPFGLVRHGVAPDHPKLKQAALVFDKIAQSPGFRFIGNKTVGHDLSVEQLRATHHAVIFACGAESDRRLDIVGEDLPGSHTATAFVGWYNAHPDHRDAQFDLSGEVAVVIGQGNVAIDVARILCKPVDELRKTDIAAHALEVLAESRVREIHLIGRRGPAQAKFTNKELRELGEIPGCNCAVSAADLDLNAASVTELEDKTNFVAAKNIEILQPWARGPSPATGRRIVFHFLQAPLRIEGDDRVRHLVLERNRLSGAPFGQQAVGTGETTALRCDLVLRSIGYRGLAIPGLPFDAMRGVIPNDAGRVAGSAGMYVAGWIKRGPSGIIGTNRADAVATVQSLHADLARLDPSPRPGAVGLFGTKAQQSTGVVDYADWLRIDAEEQRRGALTDKPREKFTRVSDMLACAGARSCQ
jgi:ferredoxin--NADP+ reductase